MTGIAHRLDAKADKLDELVLVPFALASNVDRNKSPTPEYQALFREAAAALRAKDERIAELEAALEPFGSRVVPFAIAGNEENVTLTFKGADFRRARTALSKRTK